MDKEESPAESNESDAEEASADREKALAEKEKVNTVCEEKEEEEKTLFLKQIILLFLG